MHPLLVDFEHPAMVIATDSTHGACEVSNIDCDLVHTRVSHPAAQSHCRLPIDLSHTGLPYALC